MRERMTIVISFHHLRFRDFKTSYLAYVLDHLQREFPQAVSDQRFVERMPSTLGPLCASFQTCFGACTGLSFVASTALAVCHHRRIPPIACFAISHSAANLRWDGSTGSRCTS
jgi:hypothetical protein